MKDAGVAIDTKANLEDIIDKPKTSKAGTVLKIKINKKELTGEEIRNAFSLRSSAFKITATENEVTFKVSGYGHGVGMSQYGADFMARQGSTYDEILKHYYKGTEIQK
jgi:stage II sporulation protein D